MSSRTELRSITRTSASAISRILGENGYRQAIRNGGVKFRTTANKAVIVTVYPGSPERVAESLRQKGYHATADYRSVVVQGKYRQVLT